MAETCTDAAWTVSVVENEASRPAAVPGCCAAAVAVALRLAGSPQPVGAGPDAAAARRLAGREFQRQAAGRAVCLRLHRLGLPQGPARAWPRMSGSAVSRASCASTTPTAAKAPRRSPPICRRSRRAEPQGGAHGRRGGKPANSGGAGIERSWRMAASRRRRARAGPRRTRRASRRPATAGASLAGTAKPARAGPGSGCACGHHPPRSRGTC